MLPNALFWTVHMYGIMIAVGVLACFALLYLFGKLLKIDPKFTDFVFYNGVVAIVLGFLTAALFQAFYNYLENPAGGFHLGQGITFIGGLIGGAASFLIGYFLLGRNTKTKIRYQSDLTDLLQYAPCCILIAHGFGRLGCFFAGCCYGRVTDSFLGVRFPVGSPPAYAHPEYDAAGHIIGSQPVHPTQLYEAAFLFILCAVLAFLILKFRFRQAMPLYLVAYGIFRFLIEYVRDDDRGAFIGSLSPSQFWSIIMIAIGVGLFFLLRYLFAQKDQAAEKAV